jgi:hypothetical protein
MTLALVPNGPASAPTGSSLGDYEQMSAHDAATVERHTRLRRVENPALRDALGHFDDALTAPMSALRSLRSLTGRVETFLLEKGTAFFDLVSAVAEQAADSAASVAGHDDAVVAVEALAKRLGVPVRDVVAAAGISRSTYYSWRSPTAPRPRVASQGQLWALAQAVEDLEDLLGTGLRAWLLADRDRVARLRRGDLDGLLRQVEHQVRTRPWGAPDYAAAYGVGGDRTDFEETEKAVVRGRTLPAAPVAQRAERRPR